MTGKVWQIIDDLDNSYLCLGPELNSEYMFAASDNDWNNSYLRNILNTKIFDEIISITGKHSVIPYSRKLLLSDCKHEYDSCSDMVSILTIDEYRKYLNCMDNVNRTWLLTACDYQGNSVLAVDDGEIKTLSCNQKHYVRPVCRIVKEVVARM